jgi:hypothetical protein
MRINTRGNTTMARPLEEFITNHIRNVVLPADGRHRHIAEVAHKMYLHTLKSVVENGSFVLYKNIEGDWVRLAHNDLILNEMREKLVSWFDKTRYSIQSPRMADCNYSANLSKWQTTLLKLMSIQERLYDYPFMKSVLDEAILLLYLPN